MKSMSDNVKKNSYLDLTGGRVDKGRNNQNVGWILHLNPVKGIGLVISFFLSFLFIDLNHNISVYNIILKKMVKQDWMIPSSLIMLIIVATTNTEQCQIVLLNRCKAVYQEALRSSSKGEEGHCYRLQVW